MRVTSMINKPSLNAVRVSLTGLIVTFLAHGVANAGLVRGTWDPGFGPALPGLSWTARADLQVPDACSNQGDGTFANSGLCAGSVVLGVFLRLYNTGYAGPLDWDSGLAIYGSDPPGAATYTACNPSASGDPYYIARCSGFFGSPYYGVSNVRVVGGNVVGFDSNVPFGLTYDTSGGTPSNALGNGFTLNFTVNGPVLTCVGTSPTTPPCQSPVVADTTDLTQFLVTYLSTEGQPSDTSAPKFTDSNGNALGAVLDGNGTFLRLAPSASVPEPGTLALGLAALTAIGWLRRRRA